MFPSHDQTYRVDRPKLLFASASLSAVSHFVAEPLVEKFMPMSLQTMVLCRHKCFGAYLFKYLAEFAISACVVTFWFLSRHWSASFVLHVSLDPVHKYRPSPTACPLAHMANAHTHLPYSRHALFCR